MKVRKKSSEGQADNIFWLLVFVFVGIPGLLMLALYWLMSDAQSMGITGFMQEIVVRIFGIVAAIIAFIIIEKKVQNKSFVVKRIVKVASIVLCVAISVFLVRPIVLDAPYLSRPETMYLHDLEFEDDTNNEYLFFYKLYGIGADGKGHTFHTTQKRMDEGQ